MAHQSRGWLQYTSSAESPFGQVTFEIKAGAQTAINNNQIVTPAPTIANFWPSHTSDLRRVYGVESITGRRDSCVATSTGSPLYALGATFQDNEGNTYTVTGLKPEHVRTRNLK